MFQSSKFPYLYCIIGGVVLNSYCGEFINNSSHNFKQMVPTEMNVVLFEIHHYRARLIIKVHSPNYLLEHVSVRSTKSSLFWMGHFDYMVHLDWIDSGSKRGRCERTAAHYEEDASWMGLSDRCSFERAQGSKNVNCVP